MSTMAEVLAAHKYDREKAVCTCSDEVQVGLRCDKQTHAEHVADELAKAGYGKLAEARAAELEAAADDLTESGQVLAVISHDTGTDNAQTLHAITTDAEWLRARAAAIRAGEA